jgi:hypothetical protein
MPHPYLALALVETLFKKCINTNVTVRLLCNQMSLLPPSLQAQVLQYLASCDVTASQSQGKVHPSALMSLSHPDYSYCVLDHFLSHKNAMVLIDELPSIKTGLREARMGVGEGLWKENTFRGDSISWLVMYLS